VALEPGQGGRDTDLLGERVVGAEQDLPARHELVDAVEDGLAGRKRQAVEETLQMLAAVGEPLAQNSLELGGVGGGASRTRSRIGPPGIAAARCRATLGGSWRLDSGGLSHSPR
jgi:hypothetical protein